MASVYFTQREGLLVPLEILLLIPSMHPSPAQTASSVASAVGGGFAALRVGRLPDMRQNDKFVFI